MKVVTILTVLAICSQLARADMIGPADHIEMPVANFLSDLESDMNGSEGYLQLATASAIAYCLNLKTVRQPIYRKGQKYTVDLRYLYAPEATGQKRNMRMLPPPTQGEKTEYLEKALNNFRIYAAKNPKDFRDSMGVGWALALLGKKQSAIEALRTSVAAAVKSDEESPFKKIEFKDPRLGKILPDSDHIKAVQQMLVPEGAFANQFWVSTGKVNLLIRLAQQRWHIN